MVYVTEKKDVGVQKDPHDSDEPSRESSPGKQSLPSNLVRIFVTFISQLCSLEKFMFKKCYRHMLWKWLSNDGVLYILFIFFKFYNIKKHNVFLYKIIWSVQII